ncbi:hypothetical protein M3Y98_01123700 [Aphelenchoides besseyi]|nr:hypothetical protein M3Y98_01123700 [Aphelenchoides besseyi]
MGLSCGARVLKFCLFIFNLLFLFCGIVCVMIAIFLILNRYTIEDLATAALKSQTAKDNAIMMDFASKPSIVRQIGYALLIVGIIVVCLSFMGCCGAAKEWRPLLCCYATLLMAILAVEISFAIYAAMHSHSFEKDFSSLLQSSLIPMYNGTDNPRRSIDDENGSLVKKEFDLFMIQKKCCGIHSKIGEFKESPWYKHLPDKTYEFPPSCCPLRRDGSLMVHCPSISRYGEGCVNKLGIDYRSITRHLKTVAWTATISVALQTLMTIDVGCIEFLQFEEDFRISIAIGLGSFLVVVQVNIIVETDHFNFQIICIVMAIRLFILIKKELLYLYD